MTDRSKLYRILSNIIENAIKFTSEGSVVVSARVFRESRRLEVKVSDTGLGIAEGDLASIFQMFHQVDGSDTRKYAGMGLGLYIAKKFTDLLGGKIHVESVLGEGSVFTVDIPVELSAGPAAEPPQPEINSLTTLR